MAPQKPARWVLVPEVILFCLLATAFLRSSAWAWDYEGHRLISFLALRTLPTNFPAFALEDSARERVAFLSGEPDRWRNSNDHIFQHINKPDHFFDLDDLHLYGLSPSTLSHFRYEFAAQLAAGRAAWPERFPPKDPRDVDRSRSQIGFLPWTLAELQGQLKSGFSSLRAFEEGGSAEEITNARQNVIYAMGLMSHYVGDSVQPLHTTRHFNGWVGSNPSGYTTSRTFHAWIDGGFLSRLDLKWESLSPRLRPAQRLRLEGATSGGTNLFPAILAHLQKQFAKVEALYQLDKAGKLAARGEVADEAREFMISQFLDGAQMLGDLWVTASADAPPDFFLKGQLARRKLPGRPAGEPKASAIPATPQN